MEDIPRRARLDLNTDAELAIQNAINEVEKIGADERLTKAVILLGEAKDMVSDYTDDIELTQPNTDTKQYLFVYRIGRRQNEGYGNHALVSARSKEEAKQKLIEATRRTRSDAVSTWEEVADTIRCLNID